ncbi:hypothetical protein JCGZ_15164 [Jatropha curcas]|uniref:J domain-containing protein n=1 Tax=Jatropha curcas TaxID=180498 RepID=A0A067LLP9_JATCU|nr:chaperone protein dnaJ 20, chloroplastic isoform X2 [Jatropha curcas]KDP45299.1 hypothetical protein JCGZ_15164 [Jatropha curcas]
MSQGIVLSNQSSFKYCSMPFTTHISKPIFSIKTNSKSIRTAPIKATATMAADTAVYVNTQSFYELLGISESGTISEIKKAYKQLARKYHPDVSPPDHTEEYTKMFIEVQEAYETLSDPKRRAIYDRDMSRGLHMALFAGKQSRYAKEREERSEWREQWTSQLTELERERGSEDEDLTEMNMSWGARMRRQRSGKL